MGEEDIGFLSPLLLEGKVEVYLQTILDAQMKVLAEHLKVVAVLVAASSSTTSSSSSSNRI